VTQPFFLFGFQIIESDEEEQIETSEIVDNQVDISDEGEDQNGSDTFYAL